MQLNNGNAPAAADHPTDPLAYIADLAASTGRESVNVQELQAIDWQPLIAAGMVEEAAGRVRVTDAGRARLPIQGVGSPLREFRIAGGPVVFE